MVAAGIITEDLQEVLIPPVQTKENGEKPKSRRIIQAARVLTGKEMQEEFKRKVEIEKSKEEKLPKSSVHRETLHNTKIPLNFRRFCHLRKESERISMMTN